MSKKDKTATRLRYLRPFDSSLIDTVKVRIPVQHEGLAALADNPNIRRNGNKYYVTSRFPGVVANIWSPASNKHLLIEASVPKFLTGQNLLGIHDMRVAVRDLVTEVLARSGFKSIRKGQWNVSVDDVQLLRADVAVHCACESEEEAVALMQAARRLAIGLDRSVASFKNETVYLGYESSRRSLKLYRKDVELEVHPMSEGVFERDRLLRAAQNVVRIELSLRGMELNRLELSLVSDWVAGAGASAEDDEDRACSDEAADYEEGEDEDGGDEEEVDTVEHLLTPWIKKLQRIDTPLPSVRGLADLSSTLALRLRAWLLGDAGAFQVAPSTFRAYRNEVLMATGIDIRVPLSPKEQRQALKTVRSILVEGVYFQHHADAWSALKTGANE